MPRKKRPRGSINSTEISSRLITKRPPPATKGMVAMIAAEACASAVSARAFIRRAPSLANYAAEIRKSFSYAAASLALQEQADGKEPKIRHANAVGGALQRFFHVGADAQLVQYLLKLGADRRPNL